MRLLARKEISEPSHTFITIRSGAEEVLLPDYTAPNHGGIRTIPKGKGKVLPRTGHEDPEGE